MPANNFVFQEHLGSTESYFSKFPHTQNIIQIRVSDASHLQHAYEIKDFGSTMFRCLKHHNHVEHRRCDTYLKYDAFRGSEPIGS